MGTHPIFESDFDCLTEWLEDSRRSSPSKRTRSDRPSSRSKKERTRKLLLELHSNSTAPSAGLKWATRRHTRCILNRNTRNCRFRKSSSSLLLKEDAKKRSA